MKISYGIAYRCIPLTCIFHSFLHDSDLCADGVLPLTSNEQCDITDMSMEILDSASLDGMSRLLCAFLNTS